MAQRTSKRTTRPEAVAPLLLGGRLGSRWHRDVDDVIVGTRPGAVATAGAQVVR